MAKIAIDSPKSPIRLRILALIADLFAWIRAYQKLISRYEQRPTPSQPTNLWTRFSAVTRISLKKVKKERYDLNRGRWGSCPIYSVEYRWTRVEI